MPPLLTRVLAALVFTPIVFAAIWVGGPSLRVGTCAVCAGMLWEYGLLTPAAGRGAAWVRYGGGALALAAQLGWLPAPARALWLPATALAALITVLLRPQPLVGSLDRVASMLFGVCYAAGLLPFVVLLRELPGDGRGLALIALLATWGADTGAYFAGRLWGRRLLYPAISPGKTVAGLCGGLLAGMVVACIIRAVLGLALGAGDAVLLGLAAASAGALGDLCESMLKRHAGRKDSSALVPGHGGLLDRFDGVLFAAPTVYAYALMLPR